jgi:hypothetical protein
MSDQMFISRLCFSSFLRIGFGFCSTQIGSLCLYYSMLTSDVVHQGQGLFSCHFFSSAFPYYTCLPYRVSSLSLCVVSTCIHSFTSLSHKMILSPIKEHPRMNKPYPISDAPQINRIRCQTKNTSNSRKKVSSFRFKETSAM